MGDAGSQLLGFAIGVLSVRATQSAASQISAAIPVLLLALPILDTLSVMAQRIGEGRSPFSPDKNHIHHKLLALGFDHHEAVTVIYLLQAALFVTAYFLRFESDIVILGFVSVFFAASITVFQVASRTGWRFRNRGQVADPAPAPPPAPPPPVMFNAMQRPGPVARLSYLAIATGVGAYALLIVGETVSLSSDFRVLVMSLLAVIVGFSAVRRVAPLNIVEKAVLYITATVLVYIEAVVLPEDRVLSVLGWIAIGIAAAGTTVRLRLFNDRKFQVTPLDLIVLFMALVVPSLPGTMHVPHNAALAIAKLVILFYAIEMLVSRSEGRAVWLRIVAGSVLGCLAVRPLMPF
jgi:UDP-GlcNAc:undecaprenyl-phosphate GlcNAc-1-phosphate transferase